MISSMYTKPTRMLVGMVVAMVRVMIMVMGMVMNIAMVMVMDMGMVKVKVMAMVLVLVLVMVMDMVSVPVRVRCFALWQLSGVLIRARLGLISVRCSDILSRVTRRPRPMHCRGSFATQSLVGLPVDPGSGSRQRRSCEVPHPATKPWGMRMLGPEHQP